MAIGSVRAAVVALLVVALPLAAAAQTTAFTYQGDLSSGGAPADGSYDLRFGLFAAAAGGAQIGSDQTVSAAPVAAGVFTVQLDFGVAAFPGANRFLEIEVRPAGGGSFTTLAPRQQISASPYAIRTLSAAAADSLSPACVGCVGDTQVSAISGAKLMGPIPASSVPPGNGSYIQNSTAAQSNARFNIAGNGTIGGVLSATTATVGGAMMPSGVALAVNGPARVSPGGSGGYLQLGSPNGESGLSIVGPNNRADLRFNDTTVKLVAGPGAGPPGSVSGLSIDTAGQVGIGIDGGLGGQLHVVSTQQPGIRAVTTANRAIWGSALGGSRGVFGDSNSGEGVHGESVSGTGVAGISGGAVNTAGVYGASTNPSGVGTRGDGATGVYGRSASPNGGGIGVRGEATSAGGYGVWGSAEGPNGTGVIASINGSGAAIRALGDAVQSIGSHGWLKAAAYIAPNMTVIRCFNAQASGAAVYTPPCGFRVWRGVVGNIDMTGLYFIELGFPTDSSFVSITPQLSGTASTSANAALESASVRIVIKTVDDDEPIDAAFTVLVF